MSQTTKRALSASLKNMLLQKPLSKITVNDIAEDCGVSRMTFYYYFTDIYDLVEWTCQEEAAKALAGHKTAQTWQQGFLDLFAAVKANRPFIMNVYHSVSREQVEIYLYKLTYDLLIGVVEEKSEGMNVREEDKKFIADFVCSCKVSCLSGCLTFLNESFDISIQHFFFLLSDETQHIGKGNDLFFQGRKEGF